MTIYLGMLARWTFLIDCETASILDIMHCGVNSADAVCAIVEYLDAKL